MVINSLQHIIQYVLWKRADNYLYLKKLSHLKQDVFGIIVLLFTTDSCLQKVRW